MTRSLAAAVCVAALVVTAGCGGIALDGDAPDRTTTASPTRDTFDVPERTARDRANATATTTATPAAAPAYRRAVANHSRVLREAGGFVFAESVERDHGGHRNSTPPITRVVAADLDADRYWFDVDFSATNRRAEAGQLYQDGEAVYRRDGTANGTPVYRRVEDVEPRITPRKVALNHLRRVENLSVLIALERNGTATVGGEPVARYTASDPGQFRGQFADLRTVTEFGATALVDDRGIVRRFRYEIEGELYTGDRYAERGRWRIDRVGNVTVRPPARLTNATDGAPNGSPRADAPASRPAEPTRKDPAEPARETPTGPAREGPTGAAAWDRIARERNAQAGGPDTVANG